MSLALGALISSRHLRTWAARAGIVAFLLSWFLPATTRGHSGFADDEVPGWMAFSMALLMPWGGAEPAMGDWPIAILFTASALTNLVMAAVLVALLFKFDLGRRWTWSLVIAGTLDAWWMVYSGGGLGGGYYLWLISFFLVGYGLWGPGSSLRSERLR